MSGYGKSHAKGTKAGGAHGKTTKAGYGAKHGKAKQAKAKAVTEGTAGQPVHLVCSVITNSNNPQILRSGVQKIKSYLVFL